MVQRNNHELFKSIRLHPRASNDQPTAYMSRGMIFLYRRCIQENNCHRLERGAGDTCFSTCGTWNEEKSNFGNGGNRLETIELQDMVIFILSTIHLPYLTIKFPQSYRTLFQPSHFCTTYLTECVQVQRALTFKSKARAGNEYERHFFTGHRGCGERHGTAVCVSALCVSDSATNHIFQPRAEKNNNTC